MSKAVIIIVVVIAAFIVGYAIWAASGGRSATPAPVTTSTEETPTSSVTSTIGTTSTPTSTTSTAGTEESPGVYSVDIRNFAFDPATLTIDKGDSVKWENYDTTAHTIVAAGFNSPTLAQNQTFSHKFTSSGTYEYHCGIHPSMTGKIIVK